MKIVVLDGYALNPGDLSWDQIKNLGELEIYDRTPKEKILERSKGADILLTNKTPLKRKTIESLPGLKYIGILATGYNVVDIKAAAENDVIVTNAPDYSTNAVAQFTLALILEAALHVGEHNRAVKAKEWTQSEDFCFWNYPLIELKNRTLGIIGFGSIGQRTAELALAFGMKVIVYDRSPQEKISDPDILTEGLEFLKLRELYKQSDIISLHCPLTEETAGMINQKSIAQMKKNVIIINTARGGLIIEDDLAASLEAGKIQAAALDVLTNEPPAVSNLLLNSEKTIITPHIAWATKESRQCLMEIVYENIKSFLEGNIKNQVNLN
ncbi:D-3-phosphoglycerate dehydrogenase [Halanaerobium saccharolyticum subsp. saccharolyticum DSM 6643]|uniref:D-3-phosphoglycerate dehydrogenase n=1 Tax=Halanaerobium saccharolyticum subsp. saccharolyticum DSM 6643 TaxID=1293054 RepID=M5E374_9FIRM|nr:D-2-hydroxyacid dehydrogenase [Halanaerobium saccharolyticum]CCU80998.1 D-3-phosphoglycerate dehydrogenase [Halanaerobium saccharolyticum subsp. saccharolyticum DSM 6643]